MIGSKAVVFVLFTCFTASAAVKLAGECYSQCNSLKREVLTLEMCRDAKKVLPRPKVGDFCTRAMENGFKDACYALCQDTKPVPRVAQSCRAAAVELPRPTIRKWCEHGYREGFRATAEALKNYFKEAEDTPMEPEVYESSLQTDTEHDETTHDHVDAKEEEAENTLPVIKTIEISLDEETKNLNVHEGESAEEAVAEFCGKYMVDDVAGCIRQILPSVLERMDE
mmetsp:Transcript_25110/g.37012  ORF Transcript_25110/g.37012 Transcript_25110/m.37012 type:complete len:225 (+) Transcript_25110:75-749(+)|eukprot:CAMPEP_0185027014 /NCGR_PEP_ID=MMETSP1103-20130426/11803_1 /TAXON_ID=36769 /ORGANISM="Paraphysomonas bandaiensis, Strain Caron Lab Isolate" /LENGTH=224 /DNA_ID=CAMNT_0027560839 /DNA_START=30 /DNA_END=704 /DNA_ORIENTATION=-